MASGRGDYFTRPATAARRRAPPTAETKRTLPPSCVGNVGYFRNLALEWGFPEEDVNRMGYQELRALCSNEIRKLAGGRARPSRSMIERTGSAQDIKRQAAEVKINLGLEILFGLLSNPSRYSAEYVFEQYPVQAIQAAARMLGARGPPPEPRSVERKSARRVAEIRAARKAVWANAVVDAAEASPDKAVQILEEYAPRYHPALAQRLQMYRR